MWMFWLIASGIFFAIEIFTTSFLIFWLGIAGIISLIISLFVENIIIQAAVFVISSTILIIFTRPLTKKLLKTEFTVPTNIYSINGKRGIVIEKIDTLKSTGKVKVDGELWSATSIHNIEEGAEIEVLNVNGVKLDVDIINSTIHKC